MTMNSGEKEIISKRMSELGKKGQEIRWGKTTKEQRIAHSKKMTEARYGKPKKDLSTG